MMSNNEISYKNSGVDIDEGNRFVSLIKQNVESTKIPGVMGGIGGFAGLFNLSNFKGMEEPVLVSGTDGVGTKLRIAIDAAKYDTVGIDLVAMSVNDLIVTGAKPLFFLDYLATGKLLPERMSDVVAGISAGCREAECALLGGETAEMPGMYEGDDFDLAGFAVGIVDKAKIIDGTSIKPGDVIVGVNSSGFHSNGYSLVRKIVDTLNLNLSDILYDEVTVAEALLMPTKLYVKVVQAVLNSGVNVKGMVHITGGGFYDNIPRVLPANVDAMLDVAGVELPKPIARIMELAPNIDQHELYRVFNMGIGYVFVVDEKDAQAVIDVANKMGEKAWQIGTVVEGEGEVAIRGID